MMMEFVSLTDKPPFDEKSYMRKLHLYMDGSCFVNFRERRYSCQL